MNLIQQAERLKGAPDAFLQQEAQMPSGFAPPYLILAEIGRRQNLRQQSTTPAPQTTVYDDIVGQRLSTMDALARPGASQMPAMPAPQRPALQPQAQQMPPQQPTPQQPTPSSGIAGAVPMRYGRGGAIRMAWGGGIYEAPSGGYDYPFLREAFDRQQEEERKRQALLRASPGQAPTMVRGVPFYGPPAPVERNLPPLVAPQIKEPELRPVLEDIRRLRTPASELTAPLEQRIAELEQQRSKISRPTLRDALFETGLGMLGSNSPRAFQALGQAGLGALQNYRTRQQQARAEEMDISRQVGTLGTQIAGTRGRQEQEDFDNAMRRLQQLHGAEVVRAQTEDTTQRANRRDQEGNLDRLDARNMQAWQLGNQLALRQLPPEAPYSSTPEGRKAALEDYITKQDIDTKNNIRQARAIDGIRGASAVGLDAIDKRMMQQQSIDRRARSLIMEQLHQPWIDPKTSPSSAIDQARQAARKNLEKFYPEMHPAERQLLIDSVGSFSPNKDFLDLVRSIQGDRRTDRANTLGSTPAAKPANDLGLPPATGKTRAIDLDPPAPVQTPSPAPPPPAFAAPSRAAVIPGPAPVSFTTPPFLPPAQARQSNITSAMDRVSREYGQPIGQALGQVFDAYKSASRPRERGLTLEEQFEAERRRRAAAGY